MLDQQILVEDLEIAVVSLKRYAKDNPDGLTFHVKALKEVEDFMRGLGSGDSNPLEAVTKNWYSLANEPPVMVWNQKQNISDQVFALGKVGDVFARNDVTNLSFLQLVGISNPTGVGFGVKGVWSLQELRGIRGGIEDAIEKLWNEYIRPVEMSGGIIQRIPRERVL